MPTFAWKSPKSLKKNLPGLCPGPADVPISGHAPRQPERSPPPASAHRAHPCVQGLSELQHRARQSMRDGRGGRGEMGGVPPLRGGSYGAPLRNSKIFLLATTSQLLEDGVASRRREAARAARRGAGEGAVCPAVSSRASKLAAQLTWHGPRSVPFRSSRRRLRRHSPVGHNRYGGLPLVAA